MQYGYKQKISEIEVLKRYNIHVLIKYSLKKQAICNLNTLFHNVQIYVKTKFKIILLYRYFDNMLSISFKNRKHGADACSSTNFSTYM